MKRNSEIDLFRIAGVQIAIDYSWLVIFALVFWSLAVGYFPALHPGYPRTEYWMIGFAGTILFFASVVVHELSHAIVANFLGDPVDRISLFIFGGMAHMGAEPKTAQDELKIAAAGPAMSIALGLFFRALSHLPGLSANSPMWASVFEYLGFINVALALFNLLPGFPLDGGRILRAALWARWGDFRRATASAADWGRGIAWGLIALGALEIFNGSLVGGMWLIFIALFLRGAATSSYQNVVVERVLSSAHVADLMVPQPMTLRPDATIAEAIDLFVHHGYGGYPVVGDGKVEGLLSLGDVRKCPSTERTQKMVRDCMRVAEPSIKIASAATASQALRQMADSETGRLLVMDGERLAGLVTRSGLTRYIVLRSEFGSKAAPGRQAA
jgi:Zn-dependent protease/CBS domain-containing protein